MWSAERLSVIHRHLTSGSIQTSTSPFRFKYTIDNGLLTLEQRQFYEENGYLLVKNLVEDELLDACRDHFNDMCEERVPRGNVTLMRDISLAKQGAKGVMLYNKAQDILFDDVFEKYIEHNRVLDYVECFTGPNIKAMHTMLINKPPDSGMLTSRHPLHQDLYYFPFRPADRIVAAWTAMERIDLGNGCLVVIPGTHKNPPGGILLQHDYPDWNGVNILYHGIQNCDDYETVPLIMEKGDTAFFHPLLIHGSGVNNTKRFRKAISCHYAASECTYIDVKGTVQEKVGKEIEAAAAKKGLKVGMIDVWRYRSKLVRGEEKTL